MALDFIQDLEEDCYSDIEDLYGSRLENMTDINSHLG